MKPFTSAEKEHADAWAALKAAGFSNQACLELLTKRMELRDRIAMHALQGLLTIDWSATDEEVVAKAYTYADIALRARTTVRDSERP